MIVIQCIHNISVILIILSVALIFKNLNTYWAHGKISDAIYARSMDCVAHHDFDNVWAVSYADKEPYEKTLFRIWDWGYTRILPKDKYEMIKPYI